MHRGRGQGEYRADIAQVELFLEGRHEAVRVRCGRKWSRRPRRGVRASRGPARQGRRIERPWSHRRWRRTVGAEADVLGLARRDAQRRCSSSRPRGKLIGRDVFLLDAPRDVRMPRCSRVPPAVLHPCGERSAVVLVRSSRRTCRPWRSSSRRAGRPPDDRPRPASRGQARASWTRDPQRTERWTGAARWWRTWQDGRCARGLAVALGLPVAGRIECYDISTIQGSDTSGAMVVSRTASPLGASTAGSGSERRWPGRTSRAMPRSCAAGSAPAPNEEGSVEELRWRMPDLVVVDGGKGQWRPRWSRAGAGVTTCRSSGSPRSARASPGARRAGGSCRRRRRLYLVQRLRTSSPIRDHLTRDLRAKRAVRSALDEIPGVGPAEAGAAPRVRLRPEDPGGSRHEDVAARGGRRVALATRSWPPLAE